MAIAIGITALIIGFVIGYLFMANKKTALDTRITMMEEQLKQQQQSAQQQLEEVRNNANALLVEEKTRGEEELKKAEARFLMTTRQQEERHEKDMKAFREQLENDTRKMLEERRQELQKGNTQQMDAILLPFKEKLAEMKKAFDDSREATSRSSASFEQQMKSLMEHSNQLGEDAKHLTEALKNKGKVQGDWGEEMLSKILEDSGLREGEEYEKQENVKDENGNNLRPDVIVHCSDGRNIIIDSKVSLTGFYNYVSATNDEERQKAERENLDSVKKHIKELVDKNYAKLVENAVPTVLMFIPNEGSYILALQKDPQIANEAFRKGILMINPTNLMLALHLIVQLWQYERKEENDRKIVDAATAMYEKFCIFAESFEKVGTQLATLERTYDQARNQLSEGKGNLIKRIDNLQNLGVTSTKSIPKTLTEIQQ